jgi:hypothetical protein
VKLLSSLSALALSSLVAVAACGRPSDVPALREEAETVVARTGPRVAAVKFRLGAIAGVFTSPDHKYATAADYRDAQRVVRDGMLEVNAVENDLARAPKEIDEDAKDETGAKLGAFTDEKKEQWNDKIVRAIADAESGEVWLGRMQQDAAAQVAQATAAAAKAAADPAAAASDAPAAAPEGSHGGNGAANSPNAMPTTR